MKYIVLGASAAGMNGAETLRTLDPQSEIVLISTDTEIYSRCMLHLFVSGHRNIERMNFKPANFFEEFNIKWIKGVSAVDIKPDKKELILSNGAIETYDKLLIATGASPGRPGIPGLEKANHVIGLRTLDDCRRIIELAKTKKNALVIGGGLIGADILTGLAKYNLNLSLVEMSNRLLAIQLDMRSARVYQEKFTQQGVNQYYNTGVTCVNLDAQNNPLSVQLSTGETIPTDFIVTAIGVSPNTQFLSNTNLQMDRNALLINEFNQTSDPDIYAAGDVTAGMPAIWSAAVKEAVNAAYNMVGIPSQMIDFFGHKSTMNFFNIPTMSLGAHATTTENSEFNIDIQDDGVNYKKIVHKDGKIHGAIIQGDLSYAGILTQLIKEQIDISLLKKSIFDVSYADFFNMKKNFEFSFKPLCAR